MKGLQPLPTKFNSAESQIASASMQSHGSLTFSLLAGRYARDPLYAAFTMNSHADPIGSWR
jgi:hypothetical protein